MGFGIAIIWIQIKMHMEFLIEDASGGRMPECLLPKILGEYGTTHTWRIHPYKGIGSLPKNLDYGNDPVKQALLNDLPRLPGGYARTPGIDAVIVIMDVDSRECKNFLAELKNLAAKKSPTLNVIFRLAIEEIEAWYLGDKNAVLRAYPNGKRPQKKLEKYQQDSICNTWEWLAAVIYPGGADKLKRERMAGKIKYEWAEKITPFMEPTQNKSPSFQRFYKRLLEIDV